MNTTKNIRNAKRFLTMSNIDKSGLTDTACVDKAVELGFIPQDDYNMEPTSEPLPANFQPPAPTPAAPTKDAAKDALEILLGSLGNNGGMDEAQVKALIEQHASTPTTYKIEHYDKPTTTIEGAHSSFKEVLTLAKIGAVTSVWPYLCGPAGTGKTMLAFHLAESLSIKCYPVASVADKFELIGFVDANGTYQETPLYQAMKHGGVFFFDELDASAPEAVTAFNMALANGVYTFPNGETVRQHKDCYFMAAGNTFGTGATATYSSRELLDGATRNRFTKVNIDYCKNIENSLAHSAAISINKDYCVESVRQWIETIKSARAYTIKHELTAIFSPRQSCQGAAMIASGQFSAAQVRKSILGAELSPAQMKEI